MNSSKALFKAISGKRAKTALVLLEAGADPNAVFNSSDIDDINYYPGDTPLHVAAQANLVDVILKLLELGADVNAVDRHKTTPLTRAADRGNVEAVTTLLANGANPNPVGLALPLHLAAFRRHTEVTRILLEAGARLYPTVLNDALKNLGFEVDLLKLLLAYGTDVNAPDESGQTAFDLAMNKLGAEGIQLFAPKAVWDPESKPFFEKAEKAARTSLEQGCPAYLYAILRDPGYGPRPGSIPSLEESLSIIGLDSKTGLPIRSTVWHSPRQPTGGTIFYRKDFVQDLYQTILGHYTGVSRYSQEHGLPWNSKKQWLDEIFNPANYFTKCEVRKAAYRLHPESAAITSADGVTSIYLKRESILGPDELSLQLTSQKLWPEKFFNSLEHYAAREPISDGVPGQGQQGPWSETPLNRRLLLTQFFPVRFVEVAWGPPSSNLAFIAIHGKSPPEIKYWVLDLQLGEWLFPIYRKVLWP
jgi:hypothetical protein